MLQDLGGGSRSWAYARLWLLVCGLLGLGLGLSGCTTLPADEVEPPPLGEKAPPPPSVPLSYGGHWTVRYGDSPRNIGGGFVWAQPSETSSPDWKDTGPFRRFPGRQGNYFLWVRTRLHGPPLRDGVMFMSGVDNIFEAYLDGRLVYRYGEMTGSPPFRFIGFRSHFIPIGTEYEGKTLALRIYSDLRNIGPFGEPRLGERAEITTDLFVEDFGRVVAAALLMLLGTTVLALYLLRKEERSYLMYGGAIAG